MTNLVSSLLIIIMIAVGSIGFIFLTASFQDTYSPTVVNDTANNTINKSSIDTVQNINKPISDNIGLAVLMGLLLFVLSLLGAIGWVLNR
jgi:hypothetical protein